jgi:hypothetical protein
MYRPNFCANCGVKVLRLRWHIWTSRRFCDACARRLRKVRFQSLLFTGLALISTGYLAGRARRPVAPPLTIERRADSPLSDVGASNSLHAQGSRAEDSRVAQPSASPAIAEDVYLCGARTKKGTPCSRRVHGPVRCWQHKGLPAMLPQEKLRIKDLAP